MLSIWTPDSTSFGLESTFRLCSAFRDIQTTGKDEIPSQKLTYTQMSKGKIFVPE